MKHAKWTALPVIAALLAPVPAAFAAGTGAAAKDSPRIASARPDPVPASAPPASAQPASPRPASAQPASPRPASAQPASPRLASAPPASSETVPGVIGEQPGAPAERMADSIAEFYASGKLRLY